MQTEKVALTLYKADTPLQHSDACFQGVGPPLPLLAGLSRLLLSCCQPLLQPLHIPRHIHSTHSSPSSTSTVSLLMPSHLLLLLLLLQLLLLLLAYCLPCKLTLQLLWQLPLRLLMVVLFLHPVLLMLGSCVRRAR